LHANAVLAEDVLDYSVLFAEIADAYFEKDMFSEAKPIYELLGGDPAVSRTITDPRSGS
jgi:general transcription factor 3C polypeptide 3 (transcription factor C subunit 4)